MDRISSDMFVALLAIMDAKIQTHTASGSWDGGEFESMREYELIDDFKDKFVQKEGE